MKKRSEKRKECTMKRERKERRFTKAMNKREKTQREEHKVKRHARINKLKNNTNT